jgi:succinate-acetate transporter protein
MRARQNATIVLSAADNVVLVSHSIGSLRKSIGLSALFFFLTATFLVLAVGA